MGDTKGGDNTKKQHLTNTTTSSSPPTHPHQTAAAAAAQDSSADSISHHIVGVTASSFLSPPPLYTNIPPHVSPTVPTSFDQNHIVISTNPKRPRYTSAGQWKLLPSPSPSQKQAATLPYQQVAPVVLSNESTPSPSAPSNQPPSATPAAGASSSDTAASSPSHPSLSGSVGQECTNLSEAGGDEQLLQQQEQRLQMRKGKIVSPPWKPNESLWLARAWRIQYEGAPPQEVQGLSGQAATVRSSGTKTRAEKDKQVSEYLKSHGVNRDAKQAGTKWDNMLGDYRRVYKWERFGGRDQTGRSFFRLSSIERKGYNLPATFDEQVYDELCQFMGSRMRTLISNSRPGAFDDPRPSHLLIRSLPPPPVFRDDNDIPLTARAKQLGLTSGSEACGQGGRGTLLGYDTGCSTDVMVTPSRDLKRIGKVRMIWEESVNLWGEEGEHHRGRVKVQGLSFLNADELTYLDDSMVACTLETFEDATPLKGFSVDRFLSGQQIKVFGRRNSSSSAPLNPASFSGFHDRIQVASTEPSIRSISAWEFQDPTDYYLGCLKIPPSALPSLVELSWHLQEPPAEELRFPLRKDVYRDLPPGKELFFTTSSELLDCRAIAYEILSPIIRPNPSLTASTRESFIGLWDDCINRLISKFCSLEMVFIRKPSSHSAEDSFQDQWPNLTAFVQNFCLWRGEETDQVREGHVDPSNSVMEKLSWTYMDLPYVLGYYAVGYTVTFCALSQSQDGNIIRTDLHTLDLSTPTERLKALIPCWRVAGLLSLLAERCLFHINKVGKSLKLLPYSDFERIDLGDGNLVEMTPNTVTKYFSNKRKWCAVKEIYTFLDQRIPHSEIIYGVSEKDLALTFKPRGCKLKPRTIDQLIEALKCVTEALVALHDLSFMHRDLEWDKVVMRRSRERENNVEWYLTGFEEAVGAPQIYPHSAASGKHAPEMGRGMHGVKVDVWGVGMLVKSSGVASVPKLLRELQNRCLDPNPEQRPTAADCYHHLLQLHSSMPPSTTFD